MDKLEEALITIRNSSQRTNRDGEVIEVPAVIRVAAHAALLVFNKYHSLLGQCEIYPIAIGMFHHSILLEY